MIDDAFAEATSRHPEHRRRWIVLVDGNRVQLRRIQCAARKHAVEITIVLDVMHVLEYLWHAAYAFHAEGTDAAQDWVEHQFVKLLSGRTGGAIAKALRLMIKSHGLDAATAKPVTKAASDLVRNTHFLHYDRALADGLPIATAVIEGACSYLVKDRLGRTGAVFSAAGAGPSCSSVRFAPAATSKTIGSSTSRKSAIGPTSHATQTAKSLTRCHASRRSFGWSSDRNSFRRARRQRAAPIRLSPLNQLHGCCALTVGEAAFCEPAKMIDEIRLLEVSTR